MRSIRPIMLAQSPGRRERDIESIQTLIKELRAVGLPSIKLQHEYSWGCCVRQDTGREDAEL